MERSLALLKRKNQQQLPFTNRTASTVRKAGRHRPEYAGEVIGSRYEGWTRLATKRVNVGDMLKPATTHHILMRAFELE